MSFASRSMRATVVTAWVTILVCLTSCTQPATTSPVQHGVDCTDPTLPQDKWVKLCTPQGSSAPSGPSDERDASGSSEDSSGTDDPAAGTFNIDETVNLAGWTVSVSQIDWNADAEIAAANEFNDPAEGRYVMVAYRAVYHGAERKADAQYDLSWSFTTRDNKVHEAVAVVATEDVGSTTEVRKNGTATGHVVFDLDPNKTDDGLLSVEEMSNDGSSFADFKVSSKGAKSASDDDSFTKTFEHFSVSVLDKKVAGSVTGYKVKVCVVKLGPDPQGNRTRVSRDPWSFPVEGQDVPAEAASRFGRPYPAESLLSVGECVSGWLTYDDEDGTKAPADAIKYSNSYGETATFDK